MVVQHTLSNSRWHFTLFHPSIPMIVLDEIRSVVASTPTKTRGTMYLLAMSLASSAPI